MTQAEKPFIVVATPCYGGLVTEGYMMSVLRVLLHGSQGAFDYDLVLLAGDSLISRARSVLVSRFLNNPRATHLLFIDADISFEIDQVLRLLQFDKDFVAGQYPLKQIDWRALPARAVKGEPLEAAGLTYVGMPEIGEDLCVEDGFAKGHYAGTGFQLIKRCVFERMIAAFPELKFRRIDTLSNQMAQGDNLYALFECMISPENGTYLSEDYSFCRRWRSLGGEIWLDLRSRLSHTGPQRFNGDCSLRYASLGAP